MAEEQRPTIIMNGGEPLGDCPNDFSEADAWAAGANGGNSSTSHPMWGFDCGFKLDYDGPLLSVSSRFYPPKTHYGEKWDGRVQVLLLGDYLFSKEFECETLEDLRTSVETYVAGLARTLRSQLILTACAPADTMEVQ